jgi:hypothetical protein
MVKNEICSYTVTKRATSCILNFFNKIFWLQACPQAALDWLSIQVTRNRYAQTWLLSSLGTGTHFFIFIFYYDTLKKTIVSERFCN